MQILNTYVYSCSSSSFSGWSQKKGNRRRRETTRRRRRQGAVVVIGDSNFVPKIWREWPYYQVAISGAAFSNFEDKLGSLVKEAAVDVRLAKAVIICLGINDRHGKISTSRRILEVYWYVRDAFPHIPVYHLEVPVNKVASY